MMVKRNSWRLTACLLKEEKRKPRDGGQANLQLRVAQRRQPATLRAVGINGHFFKPWALREEKAK
jgi:hypothetical protein